MTDEQKALAWTLIKIGLVGTVIGVPLGLWAIPRLSAWQSAALLTAAGFAVKLKMLPHESSGRIDEA